MQLLLRNHRTLNLNTERIWSAYGTALYFFILKRVRDAVAAQDVLQNTFVKIHLHLEGLKDPGKARSWAFQIARNELADHFKGRADTVLLKDLELSEGFVGKDDFCCFERFLKELPENYRAVVHLVYLEGKTNLEAADQLGLSLPNVKARIRSAKKILKQRFQECCLYRINKSGKLVGEPNCAVCDLS